MDERPHVELYIRADASDAERDHEALIERLHRLKNAGQVGKYTLFVHRRGRRRSQNDKPTPRSQLRSRYDRFRTWAEQNGRELIGVGERTVKSTLTGTTVTRREFPPVLLAEYVDGDLTFVAPSGDGTSTTSVPERLETYA